MAKPLCFVRRNELVELTMRTIDGRALLKPCAEVTAIILGVLARCLSLYEIQLHGFTFLSNHAHLLATVRDARNLTGFTRDLKREISRAIKRLWEWDHTVWGLPSPAIPILDDVSAVERLGYTLSNGVKEGLVDRPERWPGASSTLALLGDMTIAAPPFKWRPRNQRRTTLERWDADGGDPQLIRLAPLPGWVGLPNQQRRFVIQTMLDEITRRAAVERGGRPSLGTAKLLALDPTHPFDLDSTPPPLAHFSDRSAYEAYLAERDAYHASFRRSARQLRLTPPAVRFPSGACIPSPGFEES